MGNCQKNEDEIRTIQIVPPKSFLTLKCHTWNKDYQGLFDYQSKDLCKEEIKVNQSGVLVKDKKSSPFAFVPCEELSNQTAKALSSGLKFSVTRNPKLKGFVVSSIKIVQNQQVLEKIIWQVVKSMSGKKYPLKQGDIIKLGRQKFKIKQKVFKETQSKNDQEPKQPPLITRLSIYQNLTKQANANQKQFTPEQTSQIVCRVCLDPGEPNNPLITPCKCQGYLKYIHLDCLRTWLGKRLQPSIKQYSVIINWKPLVCEICTSHFMYKVYLDGKKYYTVQIPRPDKPYIVLQILNKSNNHDKFYNLISFAQKNKLRLGRKHDIDIRISDDISVSRNHATITYDSQTAQFILEDNSSKFGTLVLQKKFRIDESSPAMFQVGPNLFSVKMVKGLDQPEQDIYSETQKDIEEQDDGSYEQSDSQQNVDIAPQDLSPTLPKKASTNSTITNPQIISSPQPNIMITNQSPLKKIQQQHLSKQQSNQCLKIQLNNNQIHKVEQIAKSKQELIQQQKVEEIPSNQIIFPDEHHESFQHHVRT